MKFCELCREHCDSWTGKCLYEEETENPTPDLIAMWEEGRCPFFSCELWTRETTDPDYYD